MKKPYIITHRGIEQEKQKFPESSLAAFDDHLSRGFGIEFDLNISQGGDLIVFHDSTLTRISNGRDKRNISDLNLGEISNIFSVNSLESPARIENILGLIRERSKVGKSMNALHVKGKFQTEEIEDKLVDVLAGYQDIFEKIIIFDVLPAFSRKMHLRFPQLNLAPSVAHDFDVLRFKASTSGTLLTVTEALTHIKEGVYSWVWLDEWDRKDQSSKKLFYDSKTFETFKALGIKIALVTPELHATSPGLLGGEVHEDAATKEKLFLRIEEILKLEPDAVCTDYPELVRNL